MSVYLPCCQNQDNRQPYIGVDSSCPKNAIFCIEHDPHRNKEGLFHQMMPLTQFRRTINQKKFKMADKVAVLTDRYNLFMDELIKQITELKLRKSVELSMLWLRELATTQEEYQNLRKIYRNDYEGLTCRDVHWLYFKVVSNQTLEKQKLEDIQCYKEICKVMDALSQSVKAKMLINQKVMELEGIVQKGQLLKRAMPDRRVLKDNTKQILLQSLNPKIFDIKYNKVILKQGSRNFQSIFSKYPLITHTNYNLYIRTKYANVLLGICDQHLKKSKDQISDLHYSQHSIVYNCTNGCIYRDGMFESGSSHLTKGQKELELMIRVTDMELLILLGKNVVTRINVQGFKAKKLFLHLLLRTQGDSIQIQRDKYQVKDQQIGLIQIPKSQWEQKIEECSEMSSSLEQSRQYKLNVVKAADENHLVSLNSPYILKQQNYESDSSKPPIQRASMIESMFQVKKNKLLQQAVPVQQSVNLKQSFGLKQSIPLKASNYSNLGERENVTNHIANTQKNISRKEVSNVIIDMDHSLEDDLTDKTQSKYGMNNSYLHPQEQARSVMGIRSQADDELLNPAVIMPLKKSQFDVSMKSSDERSRYDLTGMSPLPSMKMLQRRVSGLTNTNGGLRRTENNFGDEWL